MEFTGLLLCLIVDILVLIFVKIRKKNAKVRSNLSKSPVKRYNRVTSRKRMTDFGTIMKKLDIPKQLELTKKTKGTLNSKFDRETLVVMPGPQLTDDLSPEEIEERIKRQESPENNQDYPDNLRESINFSEALGDNCEANFGTLLYSQPRENTPSAILCYIEESEEFGEFLRIYKSIYGNEIPPTSLTFRDVWLPDGVIAPNDFKGITGSVPHRKLTGIIGPSNEKKKLLLEILSGQKPCESGIIEINGRVTDMTKNKYISGYVGKEDAFLKNLSIRDNIAHAAKIKLSNSLKSDEIEVCLNAVINLLNLSSIEHCIPMEVSGGMSAAQMKRVGIAIELVAVPLMLFLEDPVSGMDLAPALSIMGVLKSLASIGFTIVISLGEAKSEVLEMLDESIITSQDGRVIYFGPWNETHPYFESLGFEFRQRQDTSAYLNDIAMGNGLVKGVEKIPSPYQLFIYWDSYVTTPSYIFRGREGKQFIPKNASFFHDYERKDGGRESKGDSEMLHELNPMILERKQFWIYQFWRCHMRSIYQQLNSGWYLVLELTASSLFGAIVGAFTLSQGREVFRGIYRTPFTTLSPSPTYWSPTIVGALFSIATSLVGTVPAMNFFPRDREVYNRERRSDYSLSAYYMGKVTSIMYRVAISSLHIISVFAAIGRYTGSFMSGYLAVSLSTLGVYSIAFFLGITSTERRAIQYLAIIQNIVSALLGAYGLQLLAVLGSKNIGGIMMEANFHKWITEAFYTLLTRSYRHVYQFQISLTSGFILDRFIIDMLMVLILSAVLQFGAMLKLVRSSPQ